MNKLIINIAALLGLAATSASGTSITFAVDSGAVYDGATAITKDNGSGYTAYGLFGDISSFDFSSSAAFASDLNDSGFGVSTLTAVPAVAPVPNVWLQAVDSGAPGQSANLIIFNGTDLAASTTWGVVTSSYLTIGFGAEQLNFASTTNKWDSAYAGTLNVGTDFTLVPEPSTYAVIAGVFALSYVMVRRRRA